MIIPIRCFTCNKVISSIYPEYLKEINKINQLDSIDKDIESEGADQTDIEEIKSIKKIQLFEKLGIKRYCCKRHMISTVNLIDII